MNPEIKKTQSANSKTQKRKQQRCKAKLLEKERIKYLTEHVEKLDTCLECGFNTNVPSYVANHAVDCKLADKCLQCQSRGLHKSDCSIAKCMRCGAKRPTGGTIEHNIECLQGKRERLPGIMSLSYLDTLPEMPLLGRFSNRLTSMERDVKGTFAFKAMKQTC